MLPNMNDFCEFTRVNARRDTFADECERYDRFAEASGPAKGDYELVERHNGLFTEYVLVERKAGAA